MNIESIKEMLIETFRSAQELDLEKTPTYYFTKELVNQLKSLGYRDAVKIVSGITIDLSGLGPDYNPHQEYLDKLSYVVAATINKVMVLGRKIGEEYAIKLVQQTKIWIA